MKIVAAATLASASLVSGAPTIPTVTIAPGVELPMAGLGTWQYNDSVAGAATLAALKMGYTHIDTALGYNNQVGVGKALEASGRARASYFITSKIPGGLNTSATNAALELSLQQLGLTYVDLMLIHFPATWGGDGGAAARVEEWKAMEAFQKAGKAKAIGVSHYCKHHLEDILAIATVKPAVNQVQYHVGMGTAGGNATDDKDFDKASGVLYEGFSPLCGPCPAADHDLLISGPLVTSIGKAHGKSGAQVSLKWQVQQGIPVIPKTKNLAYMAENIDLFDWELTDAEMAQLTSQTKPAVAGDAEGSGDCPVV